MKKIISMILLAGLLFVGLAHAGPPKGKNVGVPTELVKVVPPLVVAPPPPVVEVVLLPPAPKCRTVRKAQERTEGSVRYVNVGAMLVNNACGGLIHMPGVSYTVAISPITSEGFDYICN